MSLGFDAPKWLRGIPTAAGDEEAQEIAEYLNMASAPYGTQWQVRAGRIVLK